MGYFTNRRVELIFGEIIEQHHGDPDDPSPRPFRFTREQYYQLGELGFFDGHRVEFIYGEIVDMSPVNWPHAFTTNLASRVLTQALPTSFWICVQQPFSVPGIPPGAEPQPDVACIAGPLQSSTGHPKTAALLVEVSDSTFFYDITTKAELYASANVPEYWVVDINGRQLHVFREPQPLPAGLGSNAYRTHTVLNDADTVSPLAVPATTIRVADLLP
ncbi:MAG: Uma2 family endonuclease [Planctomycetaceae bacterium]|nr:Uma2 family endonuclease [Planctomycetaceae bacterium]